jgi:hypothetical protein
LRRRIVTGVEVDRTTTGIIHIAVQEQLDGKAGDWLGKMTGEQKQRPE